MKMEMPRVETKKEKKEKTFLQDIREKYGSKWAKVALTMIVFSLAPSILKADEKKDSEKVAKKMEIAIDKKGQTKQGDKVIFIAGKFGDLDVAGVSVETQADVKIKGGETICEGKFVEKVAGEKKEIQGDLDCNKMPSQNPLGDVVLTPEMQNGEAAIMIKQLAMETLKAKRNELYVYVMAFKGLEAVDEEKSDYGKWLASQIDDKKTSIQRDFGKSAIDDAAFNEFIK